MYMYLLKSTVQFTEFCTHNNLYFCSIIHILSIHHLRATCSIEKYNIFLCSPPHVRMRDFPLCYEVVSQLAIETVRHAYRMYHRTFQFILGRIGHVLNIVLLLSLTSPRPTLYRHNEDRYWQMNFCALLTLII